LSLIRLWKVDFQKKPSAILAGPGGFSAPGAVIGMTATVETHISTCPVEQRCSEYTFKTNWKVTRNLSLNLGGRWDKDFNLIGTQAQNQSRTYLELKAINHPAARAYRMTTTAILARASDSLGI